MMPRPQTDPAPIANTYSALNPQPRRIRYAALVITYTHITAPCRTPCTHIAVWSMRPA